MTSLKDLRQRRPGDREKIETTKQLMRAETRAYELKELRHASGFTQSALADLIGVKQNRVSQIENGRIYQSQISTLARYLSALGGELNVSVTLPSGVSVPLDLQPPEEDEVDESTPSLQS